jgi:hypothetical protein
MPGSMKIKKAIRLRFGLAVGKIPFRTWLGILFVFLPVSLIIYFSLPAGQVQQTIDLPPIEFPLREFRVDGQAPSSILHEQRQVVITFPEFIRLGDSQKIGMILIPQSNAGIDETPIPLPKSNLPDIFQTNHLVAEARLDLPGFLISPYSEVSSPIVTGQSSVFNWEVKPREQGSYSGNLWFYVNIVPIAGGEKERATLFAFPIKIKCSLFLGLSTTTLRRLAAGIFLLGIGLIITPLFKRKKIQ